MNKWAGKVQADQQIPFVRYARNPEESILHFMGRIAQAIAFAFRVEPEAYAEQPDFDCVTDLHMLANGIIARTWIDGTFMIESDQAYVESHAADQLFIYFFEKGTAKMAPTRTGLPIGVGDILIMDVANPGMLQQTDSINLRIIVPRSSMGPDFGDRDVHGCIIPAQAPLAGILNTCASRLMDDLPRMSMSEGVAGLTMLLQLLAHAISERYERRYQQASVRDRAEAVITHQIAQPDLSASSIAEQLGISRSTLYRAFENLDGVKNYILARRLIAAWSEIIEDPQLALSIVAQRSGFRSSSAMKRAFNQLTDVSIEEVRDMSPQQQSAATERLSRLMIRNWELRMGKVPGRPG